MRSVVRHLAVDGLHYRMRLVADGYDFGEVVVGEGIESVEQNRPPGIPSSQKLRARFRPFFEFAGAIAIGFFAVTREKIGPTRAHVAGEMFNDDGDGV